MSASRASLTIVVAGTIASVPGHGGWTWVILQYVLGLRRLGHRVLFVDPIQPDELRGDVTSLERSDNAAYFVDVIRRFGIDDASVLLLCDGARSTIGLPYRAVVDAVSEADLLLNVSGILRDETLLDAATRRVYIDLDPGFTQLWHDIQGIDMGFGKHTDFVTIGPAVGTPACEVPTCGLRWIPTLQPIVLDYWPYDEQPGRAVTTVANWRGYGSVEFRGHFYGQKAHAWRQFMSLPTRTSDEIIVALAIDQGETRDLQALAVNGWRLTEPAGVCGTPDAYQQFVRASKAELGIAKLGYVTSRAGWISDRSICYLATGRPVLAHDTGFGTFVESGVGLLPFTTLEELLDGIAQMNLDYPRHARRARALAAEYFDSDAVLTGLLDRLQAPARHGTAFSAPTMKWTGRAGFDSKSTPA
jgi:hypothetical protein